MSIIPESFEDVIRTFRHAYGITLVSAFVLGLLLLFHSELPQFMKEVFIPSLAVYVLGTGLLTGIDIRLTVSANTKAIVAKQDPKGIPPLALIIITIAHVLLFIGFIAYNIYRCAL